MCHLFYQTTKQTYRQCEHWISLADSGSKYNSAFPRAQANPTNASTWGLTACAFKSGYCEHKYFPIYLSET